MDFRYRYYRRIKVIVGIDGIGRRVIVSIESKERSHRTDLYKRELRSDYRDYTNHQESLSNNTTLYAESLLVLFLYSGNHTTYCTNLYPYNDILHYIILQRAISNYSAFTTQRNFFFLLLTLHFSNLSSQIFIVFIKIWTLNTLKKR